MSFSRMLAAQNSAEKQENPGHLSLSRWQGTSDAHAGLHVRSEQRSRRARGPRPKGARRRADIGLALRAEVGAGLLDDGTASPGSRCPASARPALAPKCNLCSFAGLTMGTLASELKSEREKKKVSLSQVAAETRISLRHLQSLEEGRYRDLPGGMYNRAFLKAYCDFLSLDSKQMMQRYEAELSPVPDRPAKSRSHAPPQSRSFNISPVIVWGLLLLISATGVFFSRRWITAMFSPYFSHTADSGRTYEPVRQPPPKRPEAVPAAPAPEQAPASAMQPQEPAQTDVTAEPAGPQAQGAPSVSIPAPAPAAELAALRLEIDATQQCWVSVNRDGIPAIRKVMEPGEVQSFGASRSIELILGNAGGVRLKINGKPAKPPGKPGEVVKFLINHENLQDLMDQSAG